MTAQQALALVGEWARRLGFLVLVLLAGAMVLKAGLGLVGIVVPWRTPPLDQSTGIALAALAYVLK